MIPQAAPGLRITRYRDAILAAHNRVLQCGQFILGPETEAFEAEFAEYLGMSHGVAVASGTDALTLALEALGIAPGDEVLVPALTAPATAIAILRIGARLTFIDIESGTRAMDPQQVPAAITPRTKAIVVVHLHGVPAKIDQLADIATRHGLALVEDCAQAHGARVSGQPLGTFGDAAAFSFYPTKNLGAIGDAGCVVTACGDVAQRIRDLRTYGIGSNGLCNSVGINSRMDEIQASTLRVLLPHLDQGNAERRNFAKAYQSFFAQNPASQKIRLPPDIAGNIYHQYAIEVANRDAVAAELARLGIGTAVHYSASLPDHPVFAAHSSNSRNAFPIANRLAATLLSLPIQPELRHYEDRIFAGLEHVFPPAHRD